MCGLVRCRAGEDNRRYTLTRSYLDYDPVLASHSVSCRAMRAAGDTAEASFACTAFSHHDGRVRMRSRCSLDRVQRGFLRQAYGYAFDHIPRNISEPSSIPISVLLSVSSKTPHSSWCMSICPAIHRLQTTFKGPAWRRHCRRRVTNACL